MNMNAAVWIGGNPTNESCIESQHEVVAICRQEHFPKRLYRMLEDVHKYGLTNVISWSKDGRSFSVRQPKIFEKTLMKNYFKHTKYKR